MAEILDMLLEILEAVRQLVDMLLFQIGLRDPAVELQGANGRDENRGIGMQPSRAAFDVEEFLGAEVGREARFGDDDVAQFKASLVAIRLLQPCAMFANGPP